MHQAFQGVAKTIPVLLRDAATGVGVSLTTAVLASVVVKLKKSGAGSFTTIAPTVTSAGSSTGIVDVAFTSSHLDTLGVAAVSVTASGAVPEDFTIDVNAVNTYVSPGQTGGLASSDQVSGIAVTGAALNLAASSRTITSGSGSGGVANTGALDGTLDQVADSAGAIDFYYQFDLSTVANSVGVGVSWDGYLSGVVNSVKVYAFNWLTTTFDQIGLVQGTAGTTVAPQEWELTSAHTSAGLVRVRFANTGLSAATLKTDRILLGYAVTAPTAAVVAGAVWALARSGNRPAGSFGEALPDAAASASGGVPTVGTGAGQIALSGGATTAVVSDYASGKLPGGQLKPNSLVDNYIYASGQPTSWRIRVFASAGAASAAVAGHANGADGEIERYVVAATYAGGQLASYLITRQL